MRTLSQELVPLVHHIELSKAGWSSRLAEQLVMGACFAKATPLEQGQIRGIIESEYGVKLSDAELKHALGFWTSKKHLIEVEPSRFKVSESHRSTISRQIEETNTLEKAARSAFESILTKHGVDGANVWETFQSRCLRPLISEVGARIYHVLSGQPPTAEHEKYINAYCNLYAIEQRAPLTSAVDEFIRSSPQAARQFILQHLHAHLLVSTASLPGSTLEKLQAKVKSTTQLTLVVDTNVLFSLLDLHDNPGNDPSRDLLDLASRLKGRLNVNVVVLPLTLDEAKRTLLYFKSKLARLDVTATLGRTTMRSSEHIGGITQRFLQAAAQGKGRLGAEAYFEPYLEDLLTIAKDKGISLYNENTARLSVRQDVVDDILAQQEREAKHARPKPYESIHHDVVLWHCVHDRRAADPKGPLAASFWLVTLDYQLLGFDSFKHRNNDNYVPVCVHPTVLVQLLQLWLPRDAKVDEAMINSLRPMLPHDFDEEAELVTLKILSSLSRYENVDDLGEGTISEILMNQALRHRMRAEKDIERQTKLVRDAIIEQADRAKADAIKAEAANRALHAQLEIEKAARNNLASELERQRQASDRETSESNKATAELRDKLEALENAQRDALAAVQLRNSRRRFCFQALAFLLLGLCTFGGWAYAFPVFGLPKLGLTGAALSLWLALWAHGCCFVGARTPAIKDWSPFQKFMQGRKWLWGLLGTVVIGILTTRIDDWLKSRGA